MKRYFFSLFIAIVFSNTLVAEEPTLDSMLQERIELNLKYGKDLAVDARKEGMDKVASLEEKLGNQWVNYLKFVKNSKDKSLKRMVLELELTDELVGANYELEYAIDGLEKVTAKMAVVKWQTKLLQLAKVAPIAKKENQ